MGVILACGDAAFTNFLNQRQDASVFLPKNVEMGSIGNNKIIFKKGGDVESFGLLAIYQKGRKHFVIEPGTYIIKQSGTFLFNKAILLGST